MKSLLQSLLVLYQRAISPLLPPACRYVPSCSQYAREAIEWHGALRGAGLSLWRLLRCHPLARGGYDPVPAGQGAHPEEARPLRVPDGKAI
ncbi:MAG: membrane protein insertion efficiency factor YidD [Terriglobales bacterium]